MELGASKSDAQAAVCCMLDPEMQPGAEDSSASAQKAAANQTLALSAGTELQVSALLRPPHCHRQHHTADRALNSAFDWSTHCALHLCMPMSVHGFSIASEGRVFGAMS